MSEWDKIWEYKGVDDAFYKILGRLKGTWDSAWFPWYHDSRILLENIKAAGDAMQKKLDAISLLLIDVCEGYGTDHCQEGICDCDPNGWEGCLTRQTLKILECPSIGENQA